MSSARSLIIILWIVPLALQSAIAAVMLWRHLARIFPFFFGYTVIVVFRETLLFFLRYNSNPYAWVYWWGDVLTVLLGIGVIMEAIRQIFPSHPLVKRLLSSIWIFGGIVLFLALLLLTSGRASGADPTFEWIIMLERSARFLQASMLVVVTVLMLRFGLAGYRYVVGVVGGFGVYSALELGGIELRSHLHLVTDVTLVRLNSVAYNFAAIIWAFYFLWPRRAHDDVNSLPDTDLAKWDEAISGRIKEWYRAS